MHECLEQRRPIQDVHLVMLNFLSGAPVARLVHNVFQAIQCGVGTRGPITNHDHSYLLLILVLIDVLLEGEEHVEGLGFAGVVHQDVAVGEAEVVSWKLLIIYIAL